MDSPQFKQLVLDWAQKEKAYQDEVSALKEERDKAEEAVKQFLEPFKIEKRLEMKSPQGKIVYEPRKSAGTLSLAVLKDQVPGYWTQHGLTGDPNEFIKFLWGARPSRTHYAIELKSETMST